MRAAYIAAVGQQPRRDGTCVAPGSRRMPAGAQPTARATIVDWIAAINLCLVAVRIGIAIGVARRQRVLEGTSRNHPWQPRGTE